MIIFIILYIFILFIFNIYHKIESSILPDDANPLVINELYALSIFEELSNYINIFFSYIALNNAIPLDTKPQAKLWIL